MYWKLFERKGKCDTHHKNFNYNYVIQLWDWLAVSSPLAKNQPGTVQIGGEIQAAFIL